MRELSIACIITCVALIQFNQQKPDPTMMKTNTLILGATGGIGYAVVNAQLENEIPATILVRDVKKAYSLFGHHPLLEVVEGDALDSVLLNRLAEGKTHIFHGLNASYEYWEAFMPLVTKKVIEAAAHANATVVFPGNNYNYGDIREPATEMTPYQPNSSLGRVRVRMEKLLENAANSGWARSLIVRLPELWGPNVTNRSFAPIFENALNNRSIPWLYATDVPQQMAYNMDAGRMMVRLMSINFSRPFEIVHYNGNSIMTMEHFIDTVKKEAGVDVKTRVLGRPVIRFLGIFNPAIRKVRELEYKYRNTILLNGKKCRQLVDDFKETPFDEAVRETVGWFKTHRTEPDKSVKKKRRKSFWIDFITDNTAIVLFPLLITLIGTIIPFIGNNAVLFGVVAGIYWAPGLRSLSRKVVRTKSIPAMAAVTALFMMTSVSMAQDSQNESGKPWEETQVYTSIGLSMPILHGGGELIRSKSLRDQSLSYFEDETGHRSSVGTYPPLLGWAIQTGFYKPVSFANRLLAGASVTAGLTGSSPSSGGYAEGYFFNTILIGAAWKYYPLQSGRIALTGNVGIASVFTKNRFQNRSGQQEYFHQFGIGSGGSAGMSWEITQNWSVDLTHSFMAVRVEVNGIGNDTWTFGTSNLMVQYRF